MTAVVVSNTEAFGALSNQAVAKLIDVINEFARLEAAVANAASAYGGTPGTEYETGTGFGVVPSATPGEQGAAWSYAVNVLAGNLSTFATNNAGQLALLDNGAVID